MAAREGIRRLQSLGIRVVIVGLILFGLSIVAILLATIASHELVGVSMGLAILSLFPFVCGALILLSAWILEGFLQAPPNHNFKHEPDSTPRDA
jgi:hypothetical protein